MYFVVSVLPISTTSGVSPPASTASSFVRCWPHVWYSTLTFTPGCEAKNALLALATASGHACCASTCSQTVIVVALCAVVLPLAVEPAKASATARNVPARYRIFMTPPAPAAMRTDAHGLVGGRPWARAEAVPWLPIG